MYSDIPQINTLTALLVAHGIDKAVVCPGSRNAPIVHNLDHCPSISCFPVTDERSAGFYALGMAQQRGKGGVAVCVTSGTALLNLLPAVAEAYYQHVPFVVISADRPSQWIDQNEGQTLHQEGALDSYVNKSVCLPEPHTEEELWHTNRLVNEALMAMQRNGGRPVHINIPVSEPLFGFTCPALPQERTIRLANTCTRTDAGEVAQTLLHARRPMIVLGQLPEDTLSRPQMQTLSRHAVVLAECIGSAYRYRNLESAVEKAGKDSRLWPDRIVYMGGNFISKRLRHWLRATGAETTYISRDGKLADTFMNTTSLLPCERLDDFCTDLCRQLENNGHRTAEDHARPFISMWQELQDSAQQQADGYAPSDMETLMAKHTEELIDRIGCNVAVHYANSTVIRKADLFARHYVWCNRGVNGIDGSISTAAGFSLAYDGLVVCITGDLSFFYDQNALWNSHLKENFIVVLINNGEGGIFRKLNGLEKSPALDTLVSAPHHATAKGICLQNGMDHFTVRTTGELENAWETACAKGRKRAAVIEAIIDRT